MKKLIIKRSLSNEIMPLLMRKAWVEGLHPRDGDGRFAAAPDTGTNPPIGNGDKWFRHVLTGDELKQFIQDARNGKSGNALIGYVSDSSREKVKELTGIDVRKIVIEGTSITHVDKPKHHLEPDDIEKCVQVINDPISVKLAGTNEQGLKIVEFKGNTNGIIYFAEAVHKKNDGWLSLSSAYRPEPLKARLQRYSDATQESPGAYARNAPPPASSIVSDKPLKKSRVLIKRVNAKKKCPLIEQS